MVSLDSITAHPQNSRLHTPEQVTQIAESITRFGFRGCILINESGQILAGHGRVMAMRQLGRSEIQCQRINGLSDTEQRAYLIADNAIAENSEWNAEILAAELDMLTAEGFDMQSFGIPLAALQGLADTPPSNAADVRHLETRTDQPAPPSDDDFAKEMARTDTAGILPIVPLYAEHHEAFIILCDNAIDEAWLRNKLGLEEPMQSYKDIKSQRANVLTVQQFRDRIDG